jgi:hypothetical protein
MRLRSILLLVPIASGLTCLLAGLAPPAGRFLDEALFHYPGAARVASEHIDFSYIKRGWISRRAVYQAEADFATTVLWYTAAAPSARTRSLGGCVTVRQAGTILTRPTDTAVLVCPLPPGTRIIVEEDVYLWP